MESATGPLHLNEEQSSPLTPEPNTRHHGTPPSRTSKKSGNKRTPYRSIVLSITATLLLSSSSFIINAQSDCSPCLQNPSGFAIRPGTGCRDYVNCQDGREAQSQSCNGGLVFDLNIKGCNWDYQVTCPSDEELTINCPKSETNKPSKKEDKEDKGKGDKVESKKDDDDKPECEIPLCAMGASGMTTVPFSDCSSYVMCSSGVPGTVMFCPPGQKYSTQIQACNIAAQVTTCPPDPTCSPTVEPTDSPTGSNVPSMAPSMNVTVVTDKPTSATVAGANAGGSGTTVSYSRLTPELLEGMYVMDAHIAANKILIARELLTSPNKGGGRRASAQSRGASSYSSSTFSYNGFKESLHTMITQGVDDKTFYIGESKVENGRVYGLVNIAAFLAMSVADSIHMGSCDEVNTDIVGGFLPISNACGQNGISYQDMTCPKGEEKYACKVDDTMRSQAQGALGAGLGNTREEMPPQPFYCGPATDYGGYTGHWDYISDTENRDRPIENAMGRQDVEGCCWWGRGSINLRGPCAYGKLNYFLGKRAADDGRPSMFPDVDFCKDPSSVCSNESYPDLKWIAGMFRWVTEIQTYNEEEFNFMQQLKNFVDGGLKDWEFIHRVSGIVTQGCHSPPCVEGAEFDGVERKAMFVKTLKLFGLVVNDATATGRRLGAMY